MRKRKKKNGAKRWPLGFGLLYVMVNLPFVFFIKIGITGVGVLKRARGIDEDMPGIPIPIAFVPIPFAYEVEQSLHSLCDPIRISFYSGSGHTETFWFPAAIPALGLITGVWAAYLYLIDAYFGTHLLEVSSSMVARLLIFFLR